MEINQEERDLIASDINAYLQQHQDKDLLRLLTCGSVDDGKSTLIGRLLYDSKLIYEDQLAAIEAASTHRGTVEGETDLALLTDGLRAEREQGITIDVAYRFFSTAKRKFIIADTPGHEQYTRNMATGASTADLAVVLVDARHGLLPQTKRHSFIASLLGIQHMIVAINKMDLVDYDESVYNDITKAFKDFSTRLRIPDIQFVPLSALKGDNVVHSSVNMPWYEGAPILKMLESIHVGADRNLIDFRLPIQSVLRPNLNFRGFQGTIASGRVNIGDEICVQPSGQTSRVQSIYIGDQAAESAFAPHAVTLTLEDEIDISRGDILVKPKNRARYDNLFEAMVVWMSDTPIDVEAKYVIKIGTQVVPADPVDIRYSVDVNTLEKDKEAHGLELNSVGRVLFETQRPVLFDAYARNRSTGGFIVIDRLTNVTVAAGMIIDRDSAELRRARRESKASSHQLSIVESNVTLTSRIARAGHAPVTLWLTGMPRAGKSTIAVALEHRLWNEGKQVCLVDGTNLRLGINSDLGYTAEDRREASRRGAETAALLNQQGLIAIATFISPSAQIRTLAREIIGDTHFIEIHINADLETCMKRDEARAKGLYDKASKGLIRNFTGVSAQYEAPDNADLMLDTTILSVNDCVDHIITLLKKKGLY